MIKILAIDDINDNLIILKAIINDALPGSIVYTAQNGPKGIDLAIKKKPDVIILDILMPGMDGFEVCRQLKHDERTRDIPVIFISALKNDKANRIKALEAGAEAILSKSIDETELTAQIRALVKIKMANIEKRNEKDRLAALVLERTLQLEQELEERKQSEEALRASEEKFKYVFDNCPVGKSITLISGEINVNKAFCEVLGYSQEELLQKRWQEITHSDDIELTQRAIDSLLSGEKESVHFVKRFIHKSGATVCVDLHSSLRRDRDNQPLYLMSTLIDITEQKQTEERLRESESQFRELWGATVEGITILDNGKIIEVNDAMCQLFGYSRDQVIGRSLLDFALAEMYDQISERLKTEITGRFETPALKADSTRILLEVFAKPFTYQGRQMRMVAIRDISERIRAERALQESKEKFAKVFHDAPVLISITDINDATYLDVNDQTIKVSGFSREEIIGQTAAEIGWIKAKDLALLIQKIKTIGQISGLEMDFYKKNGELLHGLVNGELLVINGQDYLLIVTVDITERKKTEEALLKSEQMLQTVLDNFPGVVFWKDKQSNYLGCNQSFAIGAGLNNPTEIIGKTDFDLPWKTTEADNYLADDSEVIENAKAKMHIVEMQHQADERLIWLDTSKIPLCSSEGQVIGIIGVSNDITERKQAEEALRKSQEKYRSIFENVQDVFYQVDIAGNVLEISPSIKYFSEFNRDEIIGTPISDLYFNPDDREVVLNELIKNGELRDYELKLKTKTDGIKYVSINARLIFDSDGKPDHIDGALRDITERKQALETIRTTKILLEQTIEQSPIPMVLVSMPDAIIRIVNPACLAFLGIDDEPSLINTPLKNINPSWQDFDLKNSPGKLEELPLSRSLTGLKTIGEERRILRKDGTVRHELVNGFPILDDTGQVIAGHLIMIDITDRKQAELILQEKNLLLIEAKEHAEESDRLKSAFLANMSHELRTPLNSIIGFSDLMIDPFFGPDKHADFAKMIKENGNNLLTIISDIMDISKIEAGQIHIKKRPFSVSQLITDIHKEYSFKAIGKGIELRFNLPEIKGECFIESDENRLKQILVNVVGNAIKFTEKGLIEIGIKTKGEVIQFHVKDTGIGIPTKYHDQIFERFRQVESAFTRKYGGNGLGLPISKSLIELLGGKIWLESEEGKGSTFFFTVPKI